MICNLCSKYKPDSEFPQERVRGRVYIRTRCLQCRSRTNTIYYRWGLTAEEYNAIIHKQNYNCSCCRNPLPTNPREIHIDHVPGMPSRKEYIRGILCEKCNQGLGCFGDSVERLQCAIDYLKATSHAEQYTRPTRMDLLRPTHNIPIP
jgi:Recombination endonuclease VII